MKNFEGKFLKRKWSEIRKFIANKREKEKSFWFLFLRSKFCVWVKSFNKEKILRTKRRETRKEERNKKHFCCKFIISELKHFKFNQKIKVCFKSVFLSRSFVRLFFRKKIVASCEFFTVFLLSFNLFFFSVKFSPGVILINFLSCLFFFLT